MSANAFLFLISLLPSDPAVRRPAWRRDRMSLRAAIVDVSWFNAGGVRNR